MLPLSNNDMFGLGNQVNSYNNSCIHYHTIDFTPKVSKNMISRYWLAQKVHPSGARVVATPIFPPKVAQKNDN